MGQHGDLVGVFDGAQPVGHDDAGAAPAQLCKGLLDVHFGFVVQGAGGLVQDQDGRVLQEHPGNGDPLPLAPGQLYPPFAHVGIIALFQGHDVVVDVGLFRRLYDLPVGGLQIPVGDVLPDGAGKQEHILGYDADVPPEGGPGHVPDVHAVDGDPACVHVVEAGDQVAQGGLAPAAGPHQGQGAARRDIQLQVADHLGFLPRLVAILVVEAHPFKADMPLKRPCVPGVGVLGLRGLVDDLDEAGKAGHAVLQLLDHGHEPVHRL